jgi:hypothetical protein
MSLSLAAFIKTKQERSQAYTAGICRQSRRSTYRRPKDRAGKENLSLAKVNQVLMMFGNKLAPVNHKEIEK